MKLGFVGLGKMGAGMARNLLRAGHQVTVYNRSRAKADALVSEGAHVADSVAGACLDAEAVVTMVADDNALEQIVFGENGIAGALPKGAAHISSSTISTALSRRLAAEHKARGQGYLSVPVFGRPEAAEGKKLVVMAAGSPDLVERFRPLFDAMGRQTFIVGPEPWQANAVKLCGNFMFLSVIEALGESIAALRKSGIAPHTFMEIMNVMFASPIYANYGRIIVEEQYEPAGFELKLGLKDARLILANAEECGAPMPFASVVRDHFIAAMAHGQEKLDWASLARVSARNAGL
jgi:3-hydroxyisobutyrate dehydrogenase-like beta-hydroxyacid dehydrogenase